jgi:DNA (cytosine-5)-methyltransferase 1
LEALAFEVGASDLCAAGVGSPQIRQRLFWIGVSRSAGQQVSRSAGQHPASRGGRLAAAETGRIRRA